MSSSWGGKIEKKLKGLADGASMESIQTLANWIVFNRKHATSTINVLMDNLRSAKNNAERQRLLWKLVHEVLVMDYSNENKKWDKFLDLRVLIGKGLCTVMEQLGSAMPSENDDDNELSNMLYDWKEYNVFGGPSLISQIMRIYQSRNNRIIHSDDNVLSKQQQQQGKEEQQAKEERYATITNHQDKETEATAAIATKLMIEQSKSSKHSGKLHETDADSINDYQSKPSLITIDNDNSIKNGEYHNEVSSRVIDSDDKAVAEQREDVITPKVGNHGKSEKSPSSLKRRNSSFSVNRIIEYDFESTGVKPGTVESREFLDPCKAITTLQIARDVRTNTSFELSSALANLPSDILQTCNDLKSGKMEELTEDQAEDFSIRVPSTLLDLNIQEEISSVSTFRDIVQRQQKAREKLIFLLLKSRCQFGSMDAARDFFEMDTIAENLSKRKEVLSDALELEGVDPNSIIVNDDMTDSSKKKEDFDGKLDPLPWYKPNRNNSTEDCKRQRMS